MRAFGLALAVLGALLAAVPTATYGIYALAGVVAGLGEVLEVRRELPEIRKEGIPAERRALLGALAALALGATAFFVGRTGGPLCDPASPDAVARRLACRRRRRDGALRGGPDRPAA